MNTKQQKPGNNQSAGFLIWVISGLYLLAMVWLLLTKMGGYGEHDTQPWLVPAVVAFTVCYGILMSLFWPSENVSPEDDQQDDHVP